ncbi:ABC transporter ATP-binding protein, partial [Listeria monocytogenes]|nr:ABC transporter ATP-binding protein [Listeria monocytogenes]
RNGNIIAVEDIANQQMTGKVIALKGTNLPLEKLTNAGARVIENEAGKARLIFDDDIKTILPLLQEKEITDLTITNQELEDKFMTLYEGGEVK